MKSVCHKRGDSLSWSCAYTDESGAPVDLTDCAIAAQIRSGDDEVLAELEVADRDDAAGVFSLTADASDTAEWTPGTYVCDVEIVDGDDLVRSTETFVVRVVADVTRATP